MKKSILIKSSENKDITVFKGVFKFHETHGLPLETIFICFMEAGYLPDWIDLYQNALSAGMKHTRILSKLEDAISDSYGKSMSKVVIYTLNKLFKKE